MLFLASFLMTLISIPLLIPRLKKRGLLGIDMNKYSKPAVPELGGISLILGFSFGIMLAIFMHTYLHLLELNLTVVLAAFSTIIIIAFIGLIDDLIGWKQGIKQWQHALLPLFAALPLMAIKIDNPAMHIPILGSMPETIMIPFFGAVSFGVFYSLVLVPIGITGASNATNMLAGLNGLEASLISLILATLSLAAFIAGEMDAFVIALTLLASYLAFLRYNWYPAKIFGGDTLTLMGGAGIASVVIIGDMEKLGVFLMLLYFIELLLKARTRFKAESFGIPQKDGTLKAPKQVGSLTHVVMRAGKLTEKQVVLMLILVQTLICIIGFSMFSLSIF
jgi:UDP-N-acetylglucosamine--dolichyl-phosphate N-acetylglucosaminephosphotransferase